MKILFWISLGILTYVYVIYPLLLTLLSKLARKLWQKSPGFIPPVSFIIPAYNEETVIEDKLKNTVLLDYPSDIEIIVADDGSDDSTANIVSKFDLSKYPNRKIILKTSSKRQGKMAMLNTALPSTSHDFIVFTDANSFFKPDAIRKLIRNLNDPDVGCVGGIKSIVKGAISVSTNEVDSIEGYYWKFENFLKRKESEFGSTFVDGSIYAIKKSVYPFPPSGSIIMDDFAVSLGIISKNYRVVFEPDAIAYETASAGSFEEFKRKVRILRGAITAIRAYPIKKVAFQIFSHKILRWIGGIFMITLFITNLFITESFYRVVLYMQFLFYGLTFIGLILELYRHSGTGKAFKNGIPSIFYMPYYFCLTNWAQVIGFLRYGGNKNPAWDKLNRNA